jgi:hypothetical protein
MLLPAQSFQLKQATALPSPPESPENGTRPYRRLGDVGGGHRGCFFTERPLGERRGRRVEIRRLLVEAISVERLSPATRRASPRASPNSPRNSPCAAQTNAGLASGPASPLNAIDARGPLRHGASELKPSRSTPGPRSSATLRPGSSLTNKPAGKATGRPWKRCRTGHMGGQFRLPCRRTSERSRPPARPRTDTRPADGQTHRAGQSSTFYRWGRCDGSVARWGCRRTSGAP